MKRENVSNRYRNQGGGTAKSAAGNGTGAGTKGGVLQISPGTGTGTKGAILQKFCRSSAEPPHGTGTGNKKTNQKGFAAFCVLGARSFCGTNVVGQVLDTRQECEVSAMA